ncbi:hypothetical protein [Methyloceanibacter sp.]|uniref:hypothetical protein n=1 Tax=Methyloceanibacter sp. TaxID=1965321 RepID=UPI002087CFC7|nr:hypothetical protein [Methyloceanibacter sp.]GFO82972.1 MAG: hypothetical protein A49_25990 [Methyloceanibacter sp.]HML90910.1 hypothetical protein [Methyloceanibacter sp.]
MPQLLLLAAIGAGLLLVRRHLKRERERVRAELRKAEEAMERRDIESAVPLEQDPETGIYRPKETR